MSSHWILGNYKLQMFYCVCFISSRNSPWLPSFSPGLSPIRYRDVDIQRCVQMLIFTTNKCVPQRQGDTQTHYAPSPVQYHHGTIWHCHHLIIKHLLALNMKSWQELRMMILAVAQPRFPTHHPHIRQGTYCPLPFVWSVVCLRILSQTVLLTIQKLFRALQLSIYVMYEYKTHNKRLKHSWLLWLVMDTADCTELQWPSPEKTQVLPGRKGI